MPLTSQAGGGGIGVAYDYSKGYKVELQDNTSAHWSLWGDPSHPFTYTLPQDSLIIGTITYNDSHWSWYRGEKVAYLNSTPLPIINREVESNDKHVSTYNDTMMVFVKKGDVLMSRHRGVFTIYPVRK